MFKIDLDKYIDRAANSWHRKTTIILTLILLFFLLLWVFSGININDISLTEYIIIAAILIVVFIVWILSTRLPKTPKNKVGFVVGIFTETDEQRQKIVSDFIQNLKSLIINSNLRYKFDFILLPNHHSDKISTKDDALYYLRRLKAHFIIYGRAKIRKIDKIDTHVFSINSLVRHNPIPTQASLLFSKEFQQLFPNQIEIPIENDFRSFEQYSLILSMVSKYMIGTASYISGDFVYSESLFCDINTKLKIIENKPPILSKTHTLVKLRLIDVFFTISNQLYSQWKIDPNPILIDQAEKYLANIEKLDKYNYNANLLRAIIFFIKYKDVNKTKNEIRKCRNNNKDTTWKYSYAFLYAYDGNLKVAINLYELAFQGPRGGDIPIQCEEFIFWVLEGDPSKYQFMFCLGLINYKDKQDYDAALTYFNNYISSANINSDKEEIELAARYIQEIRTIISNRNCA